MSFDGVMTRAGRNSRPLPAAADGPRHVRRAHFAARAAGFSLFELLFVISIIAIVAATAMPKYGRSVARYRAECAARRVAADLGLAKAAAKAASAERVVTFNTVAGSYTLGAVRHLDHGSNPYTVAISGDPYQAELYYADFGGAPQAVFDMWGAPRWGGKVIVRVGEFEETVVLSRDDGSITVQ
jgi:prepilin-type N-terminal cleavage/methylation domain-containing protein